MSTPRRSPSRRSRRCAKAGRNSCRRIGRRPISTGWRTSSPGASRASSGGVTKSRPGTAPDGMVYRRRDARKKRCATALAQRGGEGRAYARRGAERWRSIRERRAPLPHPRRGRARHLVLLGALAVLDARLAGRDARAEALLSDRCPRHRLRHHLLLGRPDDDDGPAFHGGGAVPRRLHPRARARREGRQDVEVEGQRHRSARPHRQVRRRCAALHARRDGGAGARHQALDAACRGLSQFRDEALERRALRRDERLRAPSQASIRRACRSTLNLWIVGEAGEGGRAR